MVILGICGLTFNPPKFPFPFNRVVLRVYRPDFGSRLEELIFVLNCDQVKNQKAVSNDLFQPLLQVVYVLNRFFYRIRYTHSKIQSNFEERCKPVPLGLKEY